MMLVSWRLLPNFWSRPAAGYIATSQSLAAATATVSSQPAQLRQLHVVCHQRGGPCASARTWPLAEACADLAAAPARGCGPSGRLGVGSAVWPRVAAEAPHPDWARRQHSSAQRAATGAGQVPGESRSNDRSDQISAASLLANASMRVAPGTMVHVEAPQRCWSSDVPEGGKGCSAAGFVTDIDVRIGADAETVSVQVHASAESGVQPQHALAADAPLILPLTAAEAAALHLPVPKNMVQAIRVAPSLSSAEGGGASITDGPGAAAAALRMVVTVPSRFCGVSVNPSGSAGIGRISVGAIKEAALHVTGGTSVHIGGASGTEIVVNTDGPVTGSVSAGRVRMRGASLALQKVQSLDARLEAVEGDVKADAVYARRFRAVPGRPTGSCAIGTLNCDEAATIDLYDGDVRIDGLDGRASILKRRQDIKVRAGRSSVRVQLSEGIRSLQILPYGGPLSGGAAAEDIDVECYLPPDASLQARLNAGTVAAHEPVVFAVNGCPTGTCRGGVLHSSGHAEPTTPGGNAYGAEGPDSRGEAAPINAQVAVDGNAAKGPDIADPADSSGAAATCGVRPDKTLQININAGPNGRIDIRTRSWMDGLRARMRERDLL